jgi:UDP-glucose 4-epimerase
VTGAAGFIGRWVVGELLARGHEVLPIDSLVAGDVTNLDEFAGAPGLLPFEQGDIRDADACRRWTSGVDAVAHLAASISVQDSIDDPATTFENDVIGTFNILEGARASGARVLFMSTCMVYDRATTPAGIAETHPTKPASPYAASKIAGEALTLSYFHAYGLPATVVRPFNTYGPHQSERAVIPTIIAQALSGETLRLGSLEPRRDLTFVEDTVAGFVAAAVAPGAVGRTIQLGTGHDVSVGEIVDMVGALLGRELSVTQDPARVRPTDSEVMRLISSPQLAAEVLGWRPDVDLRDGLARTVDWIEANRDRYRVDRYVI